MRRDLEIESKRKAVKEIEREQDKKKECREELNEKQINNEKNRDFRLVSLFNGISTLVAYLKPKPSLLRNSSDAS